VSSNRYELRIHRSRSLLRLDLAELWAYRELFWTLSLRVILVRYKQTLVGALWAVIRPLLTALVLTVVFGKLASMPSGGVPYPLLTMAAVLPWTLFANSLTESTNALIVDPALISKIYFPRLILPSSACIAGIIDFAIALAILAVMMGIMGVIPTWRICVLPALILLTVTASMGAGMWLSALNVRYRDIRFVVPFLVQFGLYISPVGFSSAVVPEKWRLLYSLNPMVSVIDGFRWAFFSGARGIDPIAANETIASTSTLDPVGFIVSSGMVALLFVTGLFFFRAMEQTFADHI